MGDKSKETLAEKIETIEKRTNVWLNRKCNFYGVPDDEVLRKDIFEIEIALFMNLYLLRELKFEDLRNRLYDAFDKVDLFRDNGNEEE